MMNAEKKSALLAQADTLHARNQLAETVEADWYEPGMMEYLDKSDGIYDEARHTLLLRFESKGTRYEGRTEAIETLQIGEPLLIERDPRNPYNPNNFTMMTLRKRNVGHMPAELCNVIAPLFDSGELSFEKLSVSYVEPITRRSRHAKQAVLFVELLCRLAP